MKGVYGMPRRGENVYKRKDGRWEGRILKTEGKYQYVYAKTYKEVKDKMKNYKEYAKFSEMKVPINNESASSLFEEWLNSDMTKQVKPSTYENYYRCLQKYVIPFFKDANSDRITEISVMKFVKTIHDNEGLSVAYKRKILTIFKTALKDTVKGTKKYSDIIELVKIPRVKDSTVQVFSIFEQRLVEQATLKSEDRRAIGILLCFYTGIRLGELCALKWSDIDFDAGTMSISRTVSRTKNFQAKHNKTMLLVGTPKSSKSMRKIPIPDFLLKLGDTEETRKENQNYYIFTGSSTPIDPRTVQKLYKRILAGAGVKDRKFHAIRHTFATRALEVGVDMKTLSEILGHSNVSITLNIYAHSLMEQKKIAMDKLNSLHLNHMDTTAFIVNNSVASL